VWPRSVFATGGKRGKKAYHTKKRFLYKWIFCLQTATLCNTWDSPGNDCKRLQVAVHLRGAEERWKEEEERVIIAV